MGLYVILCFWPSPSGLLWCPLQIWIQTQLSTATSLVLTVCFLWPLHNSFLPCFALLPGFLRINIPVTMSSCQTQFRKVPACYKYFIVLEYAMYITSHRKKRIHYTILSNWNSAIVTVRGKKWNYYSGKVAVHYEDRTDLPLEESISFYPWWRCEWSRRVSINTGPRLVELGIPTQFGLVWSLEVMEARYSDWKLSAPLLQKSSFRSRQIHVHWSPTSHLSIKCF